MKNIDELLQEIIDFGELIAYTENPANPDFQHACSLFSEYLSHQFGMVEINARNLAWDGDELRELQQLLVAPQNNSHSCINWIRNLFQHCTRLQQAQSVAA